MIILNKVSKIEVHKLKKLSKEFNKTASELSKIFYRYNAETNKILPLMDDNFCRVYMRCRENMEELIKLYREDSIQAHKLAKEIEMER